jgi:hypothetical protein
MSRPPMRVTLLAGHPRHADRGCVGGVRRATGSLWPLARSRFKRRSGRGNSRYSTDEVSSIRARWSSIRERRRPPRWSASGADRRPSRKPPAGAGLSPAPSSTRSSQPRRSPTAVARRSPRGAVNSYRMCWIDPASKKKHAKPPLPPARAAIGRGWAGGTGTPSGLRGLAAGLAEVKLIETRGRAAGLEIDGRRGAVPDEEPLAIERDQRRRQRRAHGSRTDVRSAPSPPSSASRSFRAILTEPRTFVRVTPAVSSTNAASSRAVSWAMAWSGSGSSSAPCSSTSTM